MNLAEVTATIFLAANDYPVGHTFPMLAIEKVTLEEVPTPGKRDRTKKAIIYLAGAPKGWAANKQCLREIALATGCARQIEQGWIGCKVSLKVVGDVRRPDGTRGNAFRIAQIQPAHQNNTMPATEPAPTE